MRPSFPRSFFLGISLVFVGLIAGGPIDAQTWIGPSFHEFSGVNNSGTGNPLFTNAISFNRQSIDWGSIEPSNGTWKLSALNSMGQQVQTLASQGVRLLPILSYTADWAADLSSRQWTYGNNQWTIAPGAGGTMVENEYDIPSGKLLGTETYVLGSQTLPDFSKFPPANVSDWSAYVQTVVNYLAAAPYNVQYFQVWNEAQEYSGFWVGSMSDYFNKIHLPAAQIIHAAGAKVVYGGWPESGSTSELISLLDTNNAWGSIDVIDTHYLGTSDAFQTLRAAADSRGYTNLAIWQTEIGFTTDFSFVPSAYTRRLYWALQNNWTQDKYKIFYFANWAPNDSTAYGYDCCLNSGDNLSGHGQSLQALANLLAGSAILSPFPGLTSSPGFTADLSATTSMESIGAGNTVVTALNMGAADYNGNATVGFALPLLRGNIAKAERVDVVGTRADLTSTLVANGSTTTLPGVAVKDPVGSFARTWNDASTDRRTFYTVITVVAPQAYQFEAENLAVAAQTSGITNTVGADPNFNYGAAEFFNASASGQFVTYDVPGVSAGVYDVRIGIKKLNNKGIWQLAVSRIDQQSSPTNVGSPVDEYSAGTIYNEVDLGLWTPGTTSDKAFKFTVTGKNSSSTAYGIAIDYIKLIGQNPPAFSINPVTASSAVAGLAYSDTLAGAATDTNPGATLVYVKISGPAWLSVAGSGALSGIPALADVGTETFSIQVKDSATGLTGSATLSILVNTPMTVWRQQQFGTNASNPAIAGDLADPDGDGLCNLVEYALGTNPNAPQANPVTMDVETISGTKYLRLTVSKNPAATDVTVSAQVTGSLTNSASWTTSGLTIESNTTTTLVVRDNTPLGTASGRWMRVSVTGP